MSGKHKTRFSIVRYGNVLGSRTVLYLYLKICSKGRNKLPITDIEMTKFVITLQAEVKQQLSIKEMRGEIFIPKIKSIKIIDLIECMAGKDNYHIIGIRPGEKLHEVMLPKEESANCIELKDYFVIPPLFSWWNMEKINKKVLKVGKRVSKDFE